jgi:hypothetical protein
MGRPTAVVMARGIIIKIKKVNGSWDNNNNKKLKRGHMNDMIPNVSNPITLKH